MSYRYARAEGNTFVIRQRPSFTSEEEDTIVFSKDYNTRQEALIQSARWNREEVRRLNNEPEPYDSILSPEL